MYLLTTFLILSILSLGIMIFSNRRINKGCTSKGYWIFRKIKNILDFPAILIYCITIIIIILIPVCRYYSTGRVIEYKTRQITIQQQRNANISELERVELTKEILSDNVWLRDCQYDINSKWLDIYYDKEILELKPIE